MEADADVAVRFTWAVFALKIVRTMELITILNHCHRHRGFVYQHARFAADKQSIEVEVRPRVGFGGAGVEGEDAASAVAAARKALPAELWNRLDDRLAFRPLEPSDLARIARLILDDSSRRLASERGIAFAVDDAAIRLLVDSGLDPSLGARPLRQAVERLVEGPLAEAILAGEFAPGDRVRVSAGGGTLRFRRDAGR